MGAAEDIRVCDDAGRSPMLKACQMGHLDVANWLYSAGAAEDIRRPNNFDNAPLSVACAMGHPHVACWLILKGAANDSRSQDNSGIVHVCEKLLLHNVREDGRRDVYCGLERIVAGHYCFAGLILPAVSRGLDSTDGSASLFSRYPLEVRGAENTSKRRARSSSRLTSEEQRCRHPCWLGLLSGHETTLLPIIAGFVGFERGERLMIVREATGILGAALHWPQPQLCMFDRNESCAAT